MAKPPMTRFASDNANSVTQARNALGATDLIDWKDLPVQIGNLLTFIPDPASGAASVPCKTKGGIDCAITHPLDLIRLANSNNGGWVGNFPQGEALLFTNDRPPPVEDPLKESIVIHFRTPVRGVGVQYEGSLHRPDGPVKFRANMILWNLLTNDWWQPDSAKGRSDDAQAVFLGASITQPLINAVQFYVSALNGQQIDFAIGRVNVKL